MFPCSSLDKHSQNGGKSKASAYSTQLSQLKGSYFNKMSQRLCALSASFDLIVGLHACVQLVKPCLARFSYTVFTTYVCIKSNFSSLDNVSKDILRQLQNYSGAVESLTPADYFSGLAASSL